ncbi:hypothetical protein [Mucilaginibacter auburnensis]|uniref:Uncharacterized protein n=1 Tax=Mucilaginibacter auburnensis TaxID=1457233 RepID=A0A2H9VQQ0_9SPHI|nr:hypothetical protein [Mucilaginibacter auburnensis]PJJ83113.1 hypothetical protein CLV57_0091 [Mucilaginibacter auburnensis]
MIELIEQQTQDISWFFITGENIAFIASGGGPLPTTIASQTFDDLDLVYDSIFDLPDRCDVVINPELKKMIYPNTVNEQYLADFVLMASKGLFSYDKTVVNKFSDTGYHLVASPTKPLTADELPAPLLELLACRKDQNILGNTIDISLL